MKSQMLQLCQDMKAMNGPHNGVDDKPLHWFIMSVSGIWKFNQRLMVHDCFLDVLFVFFDDHTMCCRDHDGNFWPWRRH